MFVGGGGGGAQGGGFPNMNAFQMLFGGNGDMDPAMVEQVFAATAQQHAAQQAPQESQPSGLKPNYVPTGRLAYRNLPRIEVTDYDRETNESTECSICLDELIVGQPALRIPCGHLYHEKCVNDWLLKSNECPVCRYELPTDNAEFEKERCVRAKGQKIRIRMDDLNRRSAKELRRLAHHIDIDVVGCLEKGEFVQRIASSAKVHIMVPEDECTRMEDIKLQPQAVSTGLLIYTTAQLEALRTEDVRTLLEQSGVGHAHCGNDKRAMLRSLRDTGRLIVTDERGGASAAMPASAAPVSQAAPVVPTPAAPAASPASGASETPLVARSVKDLRGLASSLGVSLDGCLEKADMVQRIQVARDRSL